MTTLTSKQAAALKNAHATNLALDAAGSPRRTHQGHVYPSLEDLGLVEFVACGVRTTFYKLTPAGEELAKTL
jgi:hypothetical protein